MALLTTVSTQELKRVAEDAYEGKTIRVMLCSVALTQFSAESTVADWQTTEVSGNGYSRFSQVIGTGEYAPLEGQYNLPLIDAEFSASGSGYIYDRVVLYIDGATYPHSIIAEDPNIVLLPGQIQTYRLTLATDD